MPANVPPRYIRRVPQHDLAVVDCFYKFTPCFKRMGSCSSEVTAAFRPNQMPKRRIYRTEQLKECRQQRFRSFPASSSCESYTERIYDYMVREKRPKGMHDTLLKQSKSQRLASPNGSGPTREECTKRCCGVCTNPASYLRS